MANRLMMAVQAIVGLLEHGWSLRRIDWPLIRSSKTDFVYKAVNFLINRLIDEVVD